MKPSLVAVTCVSSHATEDTVPCCHPRSDHATGISFVVDAPNNRCFFWGGGGVLVVVGVHVCAKQVDRGFVELVSCLSEPVL